MKKFIKILLSLILILGLTTNISSAVAPRKKLKPSDYSTNIPWNKAIKSGKLLAVNFYVDWCGYCRKFAPVLEDLRKKYDGKVIFVFIDCDDQKNTKLVRDYGVSGFPTFYLVNPKKDNRVFINQNFYSDINMMSREIDRFIKNN